ncbi:MAG: hypothetical protein E7170_03455 [Firmicutes bacterium]|nr:hypothetical protein [Bacillota bacterium]
MKRLFVMLIILFALYLGVQIAFDLFSGGAENEYEIIENENRFYIKENSSFKENNYYFEIATDNNRFNFQIYSDLNRKKSVITNIKYYKNDIYECILPIFKDAILTDVMCMNNNIMYYYHDIKSISPGVDTFVASINNYDINKYNDNVIASNIETLEVYKDNLIENHYIGITNYKGIYNISKNFNSVVYNISLFNKDIYNQKLGVFINNYYLVPDYNQEFEFNEFKLIDLVTLDKKNITSDIAISFDGYVQGKIGNKAYLFDKDKETQLEIDVEDRKIIRNNKSNLVYYNSGNYSQMSLKDAKEELKFVYDEINYQDKEYERIDKVGNEVGYYYLYKNNGNGYDVYRINIQDNKGLTYLFQTNSIDNIVYVDNYIYFINNSMIQLYNDNMGVRNLVRYKEIEFNKNIIFDVYSK